MHVKNAIREFVNKLCRVDKLVDQMAGIKVDAKGGVVIDGFERTLHGDDVIGDLRWVDFQRKFHALLLEFIKDRRPTLGKILVTRINIFLAGGREEIELGPYITAGEAIDDIDAKQFGG